MKSEPLASTGQFLSPQGSLAHVCRCRFTCTECYRISCVYIHTHLIIITVYMYMYIYERSSTLLIESCAMDKGGVLSLLRVLAQLQTKVSLLGEFSFDMSTGRGNGGSARSEAVAASVLACAGSRKGMSSTLGTFRFFRERLESLCCIGEEMRSRWPSCMRSHFKATTVPR